MRKPICHSEERRIFFDMHSELCIAAFRWQKILRSAQNDKGEMQGSEITSFVILRNEESSSIFIAKLHARFLLAEDSSLRRKTKGHVENYLLCENNQGNNCGSLKASSQLLWSSLGYKVNLGLPPACLIASTITIE